MTTETLTGSGRDPAQGASRKRQTPSASGLFRYRDGRVPNSLAIAYCITGYTGGLAILALAGAWWWPLAVLWLGHAMVIAAYLIHECVHNTLFNSGRAHGALASVLAWITGAGYGSYERIRKKHMRHHIQRADIVALDFRQLFHRRPGLQRLVALGQKIGLPAMELLMHALVMVHPFRRGGEPAARRRVLATLALRLVFFAFLATLGWQVLVGYGLAWLLFLQVLAFMDSLQHTFEIRVQLDEPGSRPEFSRTYEEENTYSNLLSNRLPVLNLLVLNFCYHNVHHQRAAEPWYRLPRLHSERYGDDAGPVLPFSEQWRRFLHGRVARVDPDASSRVRDEAGAAGVSFLTPL